MMTYRRVFLAGLAAIAAAGVLASFSPVAMAQDSAESALQRVLKSGTLRVGTTGDFTPMSTRDTASGGYVGHDIDVANALGADLGVKVEFVATDWKSLINGVVAGKYDVAMSGISMTADRAKVAGFTMPYMEFGTVPVVQKKNLSKFSSWADIDKSDVTVATTLGTVFDNQAKDYFKTATLKQVEAPAAGYQEVLAGRATVTITSNVDAAGLVQRYPDLAIVPVEQARSRRPASFLVAQGDQVWINFLNTWIITKQYQGFFEGLQAKWLGAKE